MKTLDEVISEMERRQKFVQYYGQDGTDWETDALHYLKEYKETRQDLLDGMKRLEDKEMMYIKAIADLEDNPPLTWTELQGMSGKPVWMEGEHGFIWNEKTWVLLRYLDDDLIICVSTKDNTHYEFAIRKEDYGTDWQAYRKERE